MADRSGTIVSAATTEREKAIDLALQQIERRFGKGAIMKLGESTHIQVEVIPTGSIALDLALGVGGLPKGRICEFYGPEMSGKTTLALHFIAQAQKDGLVAYFIDAEHAFDPTYAERLGVNTPLLVITQPNNAEQALSAAEVGVNHGAGIIVVDSVAALVPQSEIEGEMGAAQMGVQARLMSQAMRKLEGIAAKAGCTLIFINQIRMKIGVMFGNPETTTGGLALRFYASIRIDLRKGKTLKSGEEDPYGQETNIRIVKNKCAPPFRNCTVDLIYGEGFDRVKSLIDTAIEKGVIEQSGSWIKFGDQKWQGKDALRKDPEALEKIVEAL